MKKSIILILIGITAMGLWAKGNVETTSPIGNEKISLEYAYMVESGDTVELYKSMLQEYQKENPNIEVKFIPIVDDYAKKLLLMVASNTAPDIAWIGEDMIQQYASQNALVALDPYDGKFFNSSDYVQGNLEGYTYEDTLFALPFDSATGLLFINNDIFDKAGVEIPSGHITLSQLKEIAKATTIREKDVTVQYGFVTGTYMGYLHPFFRMANGTFIDSNGNTTFNTEPVKEIFQYFYDLIHVDNSMPEYGSLAVSFVEVFKSGKAAMMFNGSWAVGEVMSQENFNCTIIKLPQYKTIATPAWTGGNAVLSSTKNREEAIKFLTWFTGEEGQKIKFSGKFAASPTIKTLLDTELAYNGYKNPKAPNNDYSNLVDSLNYAYALPSPIFGNNEIMDTIEKEAEKYFLQTISLDELVIQLDKKVTKLLNDK
ncbi:MAG: extracellular solute-binding protein [Sphaerochaeta sp.]|nr:extracellular solute-binding protein [Sphaerochaeta sp.]